MGWRTDIGSWSTAGNNTAEAVPASSPSRRGDVRICVFSQKTPELAHSFLFCCGYFCLYGPFNCILFLKFSFSPDIILCGWLGSKHRLSDQLIVVVEVIVEKWCRVTGQQQTLWLINNVKVTFVQNSAGGEPCKIMWCRATTQSMTKTWKTDNYAADPSAWRWWSWNKGLYGSQSNVQQNEADR